MMWIKVDVSFGCSGFIKPVYEGDVVVLSITVISKKLISFSFTCSMSNCKNLLKLLKVLKTNEISVVFAIKTQSSAYQEWSK